VGILQRLVGGSSTGGAFFILFVNIHGPADEALSCQKVERNCPDKSWDKVQSCIESHRGFQEKANSYYGHVIKDAEAE
jgi:hypothetical protein